MMIALTAAAFLHEDALVLGDGKGSLRVLRREGSSGSFRVAHLGRGETLKTLTSLK